MRETPLRQEHENLGARMVDFAGWLMPVTYTNIMEEHRRVRTKVGLFDVSHMGRYWIGGRDHIKLVDRIITNDRASMKPGQIRYSLILNGQGGILDDVLVYSMGDEGTMLVVNAGNRDVIWKWIERERKGFVVDVTDMSSDYAMIAMQGPESVALLNKISDVDTKALKYYHVTRSTVFGDPEVIVSRTGYTGDLGYELWVRPEHAERLDDRRDLGGNRAAIDLLEVEFLPASFTLILLSTCLNVSWWEAASDKSTFSRLWSFTCRLTGGDFSTTP